MPSADRLLDAITYSGAVSDTRRTGDHYRIVDGDRLCASIAAASIVAKVARDRLMVETDAPYLSPAPERGQRNEPALVRHTVEKLAQMLGIKPDDVVLIAEFCGGGFGSKGGAYPAMAMSAHF